MTQEMAASGAPLWAFRSYETMAAGAVAVGTAIGLVAVVAWLQRARGRSVRRDGLVDAVGLGWLGCVGLWIALGWAQSAAPVGGAFCYTPSSFVYSLPQQCEPGWAMRYLGAPISWLSVPTAMLLAVRSAALPHWRSIAYGVIALGLALAALGSSPVGFMPVTVLSSGGFGPALEVARDLALSIRGIVGASLGMGVFAIYQVASNVEALLPPRGPGPPE